MWFQVVWCQEGVGWRMCWGMETHTGYTEYTLLQSPSGMDYLQLDQGGRGRMPACANGVLAIVRTRLKLRAIWAENIWVLKQESGEGEGTSLTVSSHFLTVFSSFLIGYADKLKLTTLIWNARMVNIERRKTPSEAVSFLSYAFEI